MINGLINTAMQLLQIGIQLAPMLLLVSIEQEGHTHTVPVEIPGETMAGATPSFEVHVETLSYAVRLSGIEPTDDGFSALIAVHHADRAPWLGRVGFPSSGGLETNLTASVRISALPRSQAHPRGG
jgi:hypothetical protein